MENCLGRVQVTEFDPRQPGVSGACTPPAGGARRPMPANQGTMLLKWATRS